MKKILLSTICLLPVVALAQDGFTIKGKVGSLNAPAKVYLMYSAGGASVTDSAAIVNGAFEFKGKVASPTNAALRIKHDAVAPDPKKRVPADMLSFYIENKNMTVTAADSVKYAKIKGSPVNDDNAKLKALLKPATDKVATLMVEYGKYTPEQRKDEEFMKPFMVKYDAAQAEMTPINKKFAEENRNSYLGLSTYRGIMGYDFDPKEAEAEFMKYSAAVRSTDLGKRIASTIEGAKKSQVGVIATDFTQNDPNGNPVKLSDFRGKYVLVDFWASWCGPCRAENPNVVAAFNKYKDKNFTVLGVSLDQPNAKDAWLKAIKDDNLTWTHVSDLKFWQNEVSVMYGVQAIPFNFLIDPTGKVVARNVRGEELQTTLENILGKQSK